jgi:hypothetical protein
VTAVSPQRRRGYVIAAVLLVAWAGALLAVAVTMVPDLYWYSYFAVDYSLGFIRRGLAGELLGLFGPEHYFTGLRVLRWLPTVLFLAGLGAVAWTVRPQRSERRLLLALLIPLLPFGFAFGVFSARTDLFAAAALAVFACVLTRLSSGRSVLIASVGYGVIAAVLTLVHEATPFLFGLGAIAALAVLPRGSGGGVFRTAVLAALGPSVLVAGAVAVLGRRGLSRQLCQLVPHGPVNHPLAGHPTLGQLLHGFRFDIDYHDWMCRAILPLFDQSVADGLRFVGSIGIGALGASTAYGVAVLAVTMLAISHVSGVPVARFRSLLSRRRLAVLAGVVLLLPIFMTGVDWIRWWVIAAYDLGIVFLLFAATQPEPDRAVTRRTLRVFAVGAVLLALVPAGIIPGFGAPVPM